MQLLVFLPLSAFCPPVLKHPTGLSPMGTGFGLEPDLVKVRLSPLLFPLGADEG